MTLCVVVSDVVPCLLHLLVRTAAPALQQLQHLEPVAQLPPQTKEEGDDNDKGKTVISKFF